MRRSFWPIIVTALAACTASTDSGTTPLPPPSVTPVATVTISLPTSSVVVGGTIQLTITAKDASGNTLGDRTATWSSSAPGVASVSTSGLVVTVSAGTTVITATSEGKSTTVTITVTDIPVATVSVAGALVTFAPGATSQLTVTTRDAAGNALSGRTTVWTSSAPAIASVSATGLVTAKLAGSTTITATTEGHPGSIGVTISATAITPFLVRPFAAEFLVINPIDHDTPEEFVDNNGHVTTTNGEFSPTFDGHAGYDFSMPTGTPIFAAASGTVNAAGSSTFLCPILGQNVTQLGVQIQHLVAGNPEYWTYYAHFSRVDVTVGQHVDAGQQIGLSGNTGCTTSPHLHFQLDRITGTNNGQLAIVDPFGWTGGTTDPWELKPQGAKSVNVWLTGQAPQVMLGFDPISFPTNTTQSTTTPRPIVISSVRYMGTLDASNPNNEYVEFKVDPAVFAGSSYDLTGHFVKNNAGDRFDFPAGFRITSGQTVRLYSGTGTANSTTLYWGKSAGIFVNAGDCAELFFPGGGFYLLGWAVVCH